MRARGDAYIARKHARQEQRRAEILLQEEQQSAAPTPTRTGTRSRDVEGAASEARDTTRSLGCEPDAAAPNVARSSRRETTPAAAGSPRSAAPDRGSPCARLRPGPSPKSIKTIDSSSATSQRHVAEPQERGPAEIHQRDDHHRAEAQVRCRACSARRAWYRAAGRHGCEHQRSRPPSACARRKQQTVATHAAEPPEEQHDVEGREYSAATVQCLPPNASACERPATASASRVRRRSRRAAHRAARPLGHALARAVSEPFAICDQVRVRSMVSSSDRCVARAPTLARVAAVASESTGRCSKSARAARSAVRDRGEHRC